MHAPRSAPLLLPVRNAHVVPYLGCILHGRSPVQHPTAIQQHQQGIAAPSWRTRLLVSIATYTSSWQAYDTLTGSWGDWAAV